MGNLDYELYGKTGSLYQNTFCVPGTSFNHNACTAGDTHDQILGKLADILEKERKKNSGQNKRKLLTEMKDQGPPNQRNKTPFLIQM